MKKSLAVTLVALFVLAVSFAMVPKKANAIPAFAQKYHFSCAVCHTVFPNLNPFGRAFWRNGFRLPGTNGTPADATQITNGLSLPNPWPIPIVLEAQVFYDHITNENQIIKFGGIKSNGRTDLFGYKDNLVVGGAFKLYTPFANSLSFYANYGDNAGGGLSAGTVWASLNGIGSGFGLPSHLFNLKLGTVTTASPYFYRQQPFNGGFVEGPVINGQNLNVGFDNEAGNLIHGAGGGFALYGTPGYHLWYKVTVTNDAGGNENAANNSTSSSAVPSNAMAYTYQLKEYAPIPMGQLEFGYYGASVAEPLYENVGNLNAAWTNRVIVNGIDADIANDIYELGATYMLTSESNPYGETALYNSAGNLMPTGSDTSNGYSDFEVYGRYLFPTLLGHGVMLTADYATYSWTHKSTQEAYQTNNATTCQNQGLYQGGIYNASGVCSNGVKDAFDIFGDINLAYNAHLYLGYILTNESQDDAFRTGIYFAF